ncbi:hypothetical protein L484_016610 [Morus notabilis]|uniref:Uncharacterized protein n=1 Tax=Morus notabilis TaxID=981085 RepID=W9QW09_9ROSA|nr:hypothetical protein L484_016610 [Morus notabilis]
MCFNLGYKFKKQKHVSKRDNREAGEGLLVEEIERYKEKQQVIMVKSIDDQAEDSSPLISSNHSKSAD